MTNKILKDEILKDEQLDKIVGGNRDELALDRELFNAMTPRRSPFEEEITNRNYKQIAAKVGCLWQKFGITMKYNDNGANSYFIDGKLIPRNEAIKTVLVRAGHPEIEPGQFMIK